MPRRNSAAQLLSCKRPSAAIPSNPSLAPPLGRPSFSWKPTPPYCKSKCQSTSESGRSEITIHVPQCCAPAANPAVSNSLWTIICHCSRPRILPATYRSTPEHLSLHPATRLRFVAWLLSIAYEHQSPLSAARSSPIQQANCPSVPLQAMSIP